MTATETELPSGLNPRTKKLLLIIGIVGAAVIGALLVYGILVTPAREPYRDALDQYKNVGKANAYMTAAGGSLNANQATDEAFAKSIETAQKAVKSVRVENEALGKKDVLQNGEGKALYAAFNKELDAYLAYNEDLLASMLVVRPALFNCNQKMENVTESQASVEAIKSCVAGLAAAGEVKNEDYQALVASFKDQYSQLGAAIEQIVALPDPKGADQTRLNELEAERDEIASGLSAISSTFTKNLQQHRTEVLPNKESDALSKYLEDKSRIF